MSLREEESKSIEGVITSMGTGYIKAVGSSSEPESRIIDGSKLCKCWNFLLKKLWMGTPGPLPLYLGPSIGSKHPPHSCSSRVRKNGALRVELRARLSYLVFPREAAFSGRLVVVVWLV